VQPLPALSKAVAESYSELKLFSVAPKFNMDVRLRVVWRRLEYGRCPATWTGPKGISEIVMLSLDNFLV